jgi:hypothetical protein
MTRISEAIRRVPFGDLTKWKILAVGDFGNDSVDDQSTKIVQVYTQRITRQGCTGDQVKSFGFNDHCPQKSKENHRFISLGNAYGDFPTQGKGEGLIHLVKCPSIFLCIIRRLSWLDRSNLIFRSTVQNGTYRLATG